MTEIRQCNTLHAYRRKVGESATEYLAIRRLKAPERKQRAEHLLKVDKLKEMFKVRQNAGPRRRVGMAVAAVLEQRVTESDLNIIDAELHGSWKHGSGGGAGTTGTTGST